MKVQSISNADTSPGITTDNSVTETSNFSSYLTVENRLEDIFQEAATTYNVPVDLLKAIAKAESDFNPNATSKAGAQGIMQLMPATARELGVTDSYDPYQNIMGGAKYIGQMLNRYNGNASLALAAYNAGSNNVAKYGGIPPFKETQNYVAKVLGFMDQGVTVPNTSYTVPGTHEDAYYESILDELFSYEDYLNFLDLYLKAESEKRSQEQEENLKNEEQNKKSDSYYSYQEIRYNPAVLNLMNTGETI